MKAEIRILHDGKVFEGTAVLAELGRKVDLATKNAEPVNQSRPTKPAGAIDALFGRGYFATERTLSDVREQLRQDGYNFGPPSVLMTLQSKDYLQRRGTKGSYRFVQKYPPAAAHV